jgi:hypothetical protein
MVSKKEIVKQLKKINFKHDGWGKGEVAQLPNIILPDEEIYECVNGRYENGFALLVATDIRLLLIDQKPLNFLTVEDLRFDTVSQMDYNHRLFGASITITAGSKKLVFKSSNKVRLRKLIGHVQNCMAASKKKESSHQEGQILHLEKINEQLQSYLMAQQQYQSQLQDLQNSSDDAKEIDEAKADNQLPEPPKPNNNLSDFLYARSLLAQHQAQTGETPEQSKFGFINPDTVASTTRLIPVAEQEVISHPAKDPNFDPDNVYEDGIREVFGKSAAAQLNQQVQQETAAQNPILTDNGSNDHQAASAYQSEDLHLLQIAISKLPMALRNRKFAISKPSLPMPMSKSSAEPEQQGVPVKSNELQTT